MPAAPLRELPWGLSLEASFNFGQDRKGARRGEGGPLGENWGAEVKPRERGSMLTPLGWRGGQGLPCDLFGGLSLLTHPRPSPQP